MRLRDIVCSTLAVLLLLVSTTRGAEEPYRLIKEIPIGGEGGWDYLSVDSAAKRLYVSHATKVVVIDTATDQVVGEIADTPGVHGAIAAFDGRVATSNGREAKASIVDAKTLATLSKVATGVNPDFILYEPTRKEVYTFNASGSATVFDRDGHVATMIALGGKPEAAVADPSVARVYVNIEDKNEIAVIDVSTHDIAARWPIAPGEEASGLAIDLKNHRLFVGAHNQLMLMMDSTNGKVVGQVPIGTNVDATWFDPETRYAFSSCGDGTTTIAHEDSPGKLTVVQTLKTARFARTMALDPSTHRIYLAAARYEPPTPGAPANARPRQVPDSMHILVYGLNGK